MAEHEKELHVIVMYRGKPLQLKALAGSTLGELGREIVDLTGVAPHTLRLILPKRPPLQPASEQHSAKLLYQSGITEGMRMVMMGSSAAEVAAVSQPLKNERIIGFSEEDQRARQRSGHAVGSYALPKGNYIFCDFQTLRLPGIELNPPAAMALKIMHKLASDRGITGIMNKYRWRVGIMTEMAPIGYVGISPKCILGFNKNRGQEISLRLRTDDLKGFRKYESIKKTLLHELAHMVHDEHDEKFHALDKKLNEEAVALDWTKSQGHTLSGVKFEYDEDIFEAGSSGGSSGYKVGGSVEHFVDARAAAAAAALRRFGDAGKKPSMGESSQRTVTVAMPVVHAEPDLGEQRSDAEPDLDEQRSDVAVADHSAELFQVRGEEPDSDKAPRERLEHSEPDPDEVLDEHGVNKGSDSEAMSIVMDAPLRSQEPDPDEASLAHSKDELDQHETMETLTGALETTESEHLDETMNNTADFPLRHHEPDPDEASFYRSGNSEPDPDEAANLRVDYPVKSHEPDLDESCSSCSCRDEPDPVESVNIVVDTPVRRRGLHYPGAFGGQFCRNEADPDEVVDTLLDTPVRKQEPDPDEGSGDHVCRNELGPDEAVDIVPDIPLNTQKPDPDEGVEAILESPAMGKEQDLHLLSSNHAGKDEVGTVHVHDKSTNERGLDECVGCKRMAGKRMKSSPSPGGAFTEMGEPQMSR